MRQREGRATAKGVRWHAYLGHAHTGLPLGSATWAHFCISRNRPRAVANRRRREGHRQPTSVTTLGGPAAGAQLLQGRSVDALPGGGQGICPLPGPPQRPPGATPAGPAAQWQLSCSRPSALRAARNQRRAAVAGRGPRANPSHRTGDGRLRTSPPDGSCRCVNRSKDCAAKHDNCVGALASRSRGKLWPRLRSTNAPWGFLRVRL